jgi:hypothetical protein
VTVHYCDERLLSGECIHCIGAAHPTVRFETWAGTVAVRCELLKRTAKRFKVRFVESGVGIARGEIRYVPHAAVRDGAGLPIEAPQRGSDPRGKEDT